MRPGEARIHAKWVDGLMRSVMASGSGKSADDPFVTISVTEEYDLLFMFELTPTNQALMDTDPPVDRFDVVTRGGDKTTVYFYPKAHFERLASNPQAVFDAMIKAGESRQSAGSSEETP